MADKVTANEVIEIINNMDNGERIKLLDNMYDKYYDGGGAVRYNEKLTKNLEKDIEFLSKKVGKFDMYFNRLNSQSSTEREMEIAFLADKLNKLEREVFLLKRRDNTDDYWLGISSIFFNSKKLFQDMLYTFILDDITTP